MSLHFFKPLWGHIGSMDEAITQAKDAGFHGIEGSCPENPSDRQYFKDLLVESGLDYIGEVFTGGGYVPNPRATPREHLDDLKRKLEWTLPLKPLFINTQFGLDAWPMKTKIHACQELLAIADEYGITISVELHRSRLTYSPWGTKELIDALPTLPITLDFSHWCCVTERLIMNDEPELLEQISKQAHHIHARIGYDQGPQVPDPRAPEYQTEVDAHLNWWKIVWKIQNSCGKDKITVTPEFGTDGYLHLEPYTKKPVSNLWDVNRWMVQILISEWHKHCFNKLRDKNITR